MRITIAGATGTLGRPTVARLVANGHEVTGITRTEAGLRLLASLGARGVRADALDAGALRAAVVASRPERVAHLLTALGPGGAPRPEALAMTNRLRTEGTANLLAAAEAAGATRLVGESFVGVYGRARFTRPADEEDPLPAPARVHRGLAGALRDMERQLREARAAGRIDAVALRIGFFYGAGVDTTRAWVRQLRDGSARVPRRVPGLCAWAHIDDAAAGVVAALEAPAVPSPVYNLVDDRAVAAPDFVRAIAAAIGAPPPRTVPFLLVRLTAPVFAELLSARLLLSNARLRRELGWSPAYPDVEAGVRTLGRALAEAA